MKKSSIIFAIFLFCSIAYADDLEAVRQFNADTPGKTYSPFTVAQGYFQIESDIFHITSSDGSKSIEFFDPVFKYGLLDTLDIELETNGFLDNSNKFNGKTVHTFGYGDIVPSIKWAFFGDDSPDYTAALKFGVKIPSASHKIGNGAVEYYVDLPTQFTLPLGLSLQLQEEIDLLKNQNDNGKHFSYSEDISLSRNFGRMTYSVEIYANSGTDSNNPAYYTADIGLSYAISPVIAITGGAYFGLNKYAPTVEAYTGFAFRL